MDNFVIYDNIWKIAAGQSDDYATNCVLDYNYFSNYYKMIAIIDLSKQQAIHADSKAMNTANQFHCNSK